MTILIISAFLLGVVVVGGYLLWPRLMRWIFGEDGGPRV